MSTCKKRARLGFDKHVDVWQREVGLISSRKFALQFAASEDLILKLDIFRKLEKHKGCVNTVSFNAAGDILVSGSDDRKVILWDWEAGHIKHSFFSGHLDNVFHAKFMPYSDDSSIITCAADGLVRHAKFLNGGGVETVQLGSHEGRARKVANEPGSPHIFYTCGEDGSVLHFDLRTKASTGCITCNRVGGSYLELNAIAIDPRNPNLFAVGGNDEYARVYDIRKYKWDEPDNFVKPVDRFCSRHLIGDKRVGITGVAYSESSELLVSYKNENIYLFTKDMGLGPNRVRTPPSSTCSGSCEQGTEAATETTHGCLQVYKGHRNRDILKGVGFFGPRFEYVVSGSDCGRIFIWKRKGGEIIRVMEGNADVVNCIEPHPHTTMLASSGIDHDIKIWTPNIGQLKHAAPHELMESVSMSNHGSSLEENPEASRESRILLDLLFNFTWCFTPMNYDYSDDGSGPEDYYL